MVLAPSPSFGRAAEKGGQPIISGTRAKQATDQDAELSVTEGVSDGFERRSRRHRSAARAVARPGAGHLRPRGAHDLGLWRPRRATNVTARRASRERLSGRRGDRRLRGRRVAGQLLRGPRAGQAARKTVDAHRRRARRRQKGFDAGKARSTSSAPRPRKSRRGGRRHAVVASPDGRLPGRPLANEQIAFRFGGGQGPAGSSSTSTRSRWSASIPICGALEAWRARPAHRRRRRDEICRRAPPPPARTGILTVTPPVSEQSSGLAAVRRPRSRRLGGDATCLPRRSAAVRLRDDDSPSPVEPDPGASSKSALSHKRAAGFDLHLVAPEQHA